MPPKREATDDLSSLRQKSRYDYLAKREEVKLAELRQQVQEEAEEERTNPTLSKRELEQFARNRTTLQLAEDRARIDQTSSSGFFIPDSQFDDKAELLHKKHIPGPNLPHTSEFQQWEDDQISRSLAKNRHACTGTTREAEDDYEFVFDTTTAPQWTSDSDGQILDPEKQRLQTQLDEAELKIKTIDETRRALPIFKYKEELIAAIRDHQILIISAETASGKSTQIPQYLKEAGYTAQGCIACTQPRRVAAMSVAKRVSEECHVRLGRDVGYTVRFDDRSGPDTVIKYLTDGMLLREMTHDVTLSRYSVIILDEAHERSLSTDILAALLKDLVTVRSDLRLIISSATLDAKKFSSYFRDAPVFSVPGRRFNVQKYFTAQPEANYLTSSISTAYQIHLSQDKGDILLFLTGEEEIEAAATSIEETARKIGNRAQELQVRKLYGALPADEQAKCFEPTPPGCRKLVIATNIAETSLTVDGIRYVIDCGYTKENQYNPRTGMEALCVVPASRASVNQRAGRAGRQSDGMAFFLFSKHSYWNELPENTVPEIMRVNMASVCLTLKSLGINDLLNFDLMDKPPPEALAQGLELCYTLGALNQEGQLTKVGRSMSVLPLEPMSARVLLAAEKFGVLDECITIIAMVSESASLFMRPKDKKVHADAAHKRFAAKEGDMLTYLNVWREFEDSEYSNLWCKENFIQYRTINRARDVRTQLESLCERIGLEPSSNPTDHIAIRKALLSGFLPNAARLQRDGQSYRTLKNGLTVYIHPSSGLMEARPRFVVYSELVLTSKEYMRNVFEIDGQWLSEIGPMLYKQSDIEKLGLEKKMPKGQGKVGIDGQ